MEAYAAFIWSILANPTSKIRWEAVHIVSRLVQLVSSEVIDSMIIMFVKDDVGAFASKKYPFYKFHAQLYFLIATLRGAQSNTSALLRHRSFFLDQVLNSDHTLLEHFSSKIAFKLLERNSKIYNGEELDILSAVGVSPYDKVITNRDNEFVTANIASLDKDLPQLSFFLDFQEYWLKPLARLFNVSVAELKQTAISIVINEWGVTSDERFINDPRSYGHKETYASHNSIPMTQPYDFYLGYHAIFTMASRLLKNTPD